MLPDIVLTALDSDVTKTYVREGLGIGIIAAMAFDERADSDLRAIDAAHLFSSNVTRLAIRRGVELRSYCYEFIELFAPTLTRAARMQATIRRNTASECHVSCCSAAEFPAITSLPDRQTPISGQPLYTSRVYVGPARQISYRKHLMKTKLSLTAGMLALLVSATLAVAPAAADKPEGKGKGYERAEKGGHRQDNARDDDRGPRERVSLAPRAGVYFADQHRGHVREYFGEEYRRGRCPPGLAKKNNGCMPPGQAKKWQIGSPIPRDVVYYDLPPQLVVQIGAPPAGYRYVRAAADILLIAIGTGIVIDALQDLGRL